MEEKGFPRTIPAQWRGGLYQDVGGTPYRLDGENDSGLAFIAASVSVVIDFRTGRDLPARLPVTVGVYDSAIRREIYTH